MTIRSIMSTVTDKVEEIAVMNGFKKTSDYPMASFGKPALNGFSFVIEIDGWDETILVYKKKIHNAGFDDACVATLDDDETLSLRKVIDKELRKLRKNHI